MISSKYWISPIIIPALLTLSVQGQTSLQMAIDTLSGPWKTLEVESGNLVLGFSGPTQSQFLITDGQAMPLFRTSIPAPSPYPSFAIASRPGGGFFAVGMVADSVYGLPSDADSLVGVYNLYSFNNSGEMDLRREFTVSFDAYTYDNQVTNIVADSLGIYVSVNRGGDGTEQLRILRVSLEGDLTWSKEYLIMGNGLASYDQDYKLASAPDGGLYIARKLFASQSSMAIGRLAADGELLWLKGCIVSPSGFNLGNTITSSEGELIAIGALQSGGGMIVITADGSAAHGHLYDMPDDLARRFCDAHLSQDGSISAISNNFVSSYSPTHGAIVHIGADWEVLSVRGTDIVTAGQAYHGLRPQFVAGENGRTIVLGTLISIDTVFSTSLRHPTIWDIDLTAQEGCMLTNPEVVHFNVPEDLISLEELELLPVIDFDASWTNLTPEWSVQPLFTSSDMCSFLVGTTELVQELGSITVYPNPSEAGSTLNIQYASASRFALFSATGTLVRTIQGASGSNRTVLERSGLASGLYSIVAFGKDGQRLAATKVELR